MLKKIYLLIIIILILAVLVTGLASAQVISHYNDQNIRQILISAARAIRLDLVDGLAAAQASERVAQVFGEIGEQIRITVIDRQGIVLYDNEADRDEMENHLFRTEISFAFKNRTTGSAIRHSATLGQDMLYIAFYDDNRDIVIRTSMALRTYRAGLAGILLTMLIVLGIGLVLLLLIAAFTTRQITRPLIELEKAALAMTAGDFRVRVHQLQESGAEVSALSHAFNSMAERLQVTVEDLEGKNASLDAIFDSMSDPLLAVEPTTAVTYLNSPARELFSRDLDPAKSVFPLYLLTHSHEIDRLVGQALEAGSARSAECQIRTRIGDSMFHVVASPIRSARSQGLILTFHDISESRRLQKMRSDFVANVTHELRTPLTSIRGFIETLRNGAINDPAVSGRFLEIIDIEAERLHKLISDILILSEIEDLHEDNDRQPFDLHAMIDETVVLLDEAAAARRVSLIAENAESPLPIHASPFRIKQVLINLMDNAIKYNYEGGKVFVGAERQADGKVCLTVRDTGPGIPAEYQDRVFERFYRVDASRSREMGGTGLGLSIVKHIAQLYGGSARVSSRPGEGATFQVFLDI